MADKYFKESRYLSYLLRHHPEDIDLILDREGWGDVAHILDKTHWSMDLLSDIVTNDKKTRYSFNEDKTKIRANYGHSYKLIDITMEEISISEMVELGGVLYHGTSTRFIDSIYEKGILPMERNYVHLSINIPTAVTVGHRHGKAVVIAIDAVKMLKDGCKIYRTESGVYVTKYVGTEYFKEKLNY